MKQVYGDQLLIQMLASTDTREVDAAISQLFRQHKDMILRLVQRNNGTRQEAEEVVSDTLVGLWESVTTGRYQPTARLKTYLYRVAYNVWLKSLRNRGVFVELIDTESFADSQAERPDEAYDDRETNEMRWNMIRRVVGDTCYNVLKAFTEGYTMQEIAAQFDLGSANNAKTIKYNCLKKLGQQNS